MRLYFHTYPSLGEVRLFDFSSADSTPLPRPDKIGRDLGVGLRAYAIIASASTHARQIVSEPPFAIHRSKLKLQKALEFDLETALKMAAAAETITLTSYDHGEGTRAIRESRKPFYEGR